MSVTRKDFIFIAKCIDEATCPDAPDNVHKGQLVDSLCRYFKSQNYMFDAGKFETACNLTSLVEDEPSGSKE